MYLPPCNYTMYLLMEMVLLLVVWLAFTSAKTYYVKPTIDIPCPDEGMPCLTLSQYATKPGNYFASSTTLVILPGNHNLISELLIHDIDFLTIAGNTTTYGDISITCNYSQSAKVTLEGIYSIHMHGLVFIDCMNTYIASVVEFTLKESSFLGQGNDGIALELNAVADANIVNSTFSFFTGGVVLDPNIGVTIRLGGAVIVLNSTLSIFDCTFTDNALTDGRRAYADSSFYNTMTDYENELNGELPRDVESSNVTVNSSVLRIENYGGAIYAALSTVTIIESVFSNNKITTDNGLGEELPWASNITVNTSIRIESYGGAIYAASSDVTLIETVFSDNKITVDNGLGGALFSHSCNVAIYNCTFSNNTVTGNSGQGGALFAYLSLDVINDCEFISNSVNGDGGRGGAVAAQLSDIIANNSTFSNNSVIGNHGMGGAVFAADWSNVTTRSCMFISNSVTGNAGQGGAVVSHSSNLSINNNCIFTSNTVTGNGGRGGALLGLSLSNVTVYSSTFADNTVKGFHGLGGAVRAASGSVFMLFNCMFENNSVNGDSGIGGAVDIGSSYVAIGNSIFTNNSAVRYGGAIYVDNGTLSCNGFIVIQKNMAGRGGIMYAVQSTVYFSGNATILNNYGSLYVFSCVLKFMGNTNFMNNTYISDASNEGGAVTAIQSELSFTKVASFHYNTAKYGGAISATQSKLHVLGDIDITYNTASLSGGGIFAYQSELDLTKYTNISNNYAVEKGGGIHAISSIARMKQHSKTYFVGNHANNGGGICLEMNSKLYIIKMQHECNGPSCWPLENIDPERWIRLEFNKNTAKYGGAVLITHDENIATCNAIPFTNSTISNECFIQSLTLQNSYNSDINVRNTYFINNSASIAGDDIFGGLLDRCGIHPFADILYRSHVNHPILNPSSLNAVAYIFNITALHFTEGISSHPVRVCFCTDSKPDCSYHPKPVYVKKGETFTVTLVAVDQVNSTTSNSTIHGFVPLPASLGEEQSVQRTNKNGTCTELQYTVLSLYETEVLSLYAAGPCNDIGISTTNLTVHIEPCPVGFIDSNLHCDCDPILDEYISDCNVDNQTVLRKGNVWFTYIDTADHPNSFILNKQCPFGYCNPSTDSLHVNLTNPKGADILCAFNRTSKLCGSCKVGLSLSLGSSRCMPCSNTWLALLIVFAIAGAALVAFLLVCNLTVAAGTINGLLFYANTVSSNQTTFFTPSINKFFTVFIAWLNLDFGFETCFFDGLNSYWKIWLQFAFPAYVIILVIVIIKACDYSYSFARLIARKNPVATLATLVLLSYTKLIRTIIFAMQFATLDYSDGTHELVWLQDANIQYFELKHILLFIAALLVLAVALVYTFILFFWQWLLLCPNKKPVRWIRNSRLHSVMDAYFITFNKNHRYWTGLLLLARVLLYLISALNGMNSNNPRINLYAIIFVVGSLIVWKEIINGRIYKKWSLNALDTSFLFNLLILAATTSYVQEEGGNQVAAASISIAITFITFIFIISYHMYSFVLQKQLDKLKNFNKKSGDSQPQSKAQEQTSDENNYDEGCTFTVVDLPMVPLDTEDYTVTSDSNEGTDMSNATVHSESLELQDQSAINSDEFVLQSSSQV